MTVGSAGGPRWAWLGRVPFDQALRLQEEIRDGILRGARPETLLFCEHDPVITLGRSARTEHLLFSSEELARRGIDVRLASRGGDVTYHGPGQLLGYPIFRLRRGVVAHVETMARAVVLALADLGVAAEWRRALPGVWVGESKICALGVHVRRGVSIHGFALNVSLDLAQFSLIVPCGLRDRAVTSLAGTLGWAPEVRALAARIAAAYGEALGVALRAEDACSPLPNAHWNL